MDLDPRLRDKKAAFLDVDGTLALGDRVIPGAGDFVPALRSAGLRVHILTNNSSRSRKEYVAKMKGLGLEFSPEEILISTHGLIAHFNKEGIRRAFVLGTPGMALELAAAGIVHDDDARVLAMGYDTTLNYEKLAKAALLLQRGGGYYVTHPDAVCPSPEGGLPDAGAFIALMEKATGRKPDRVFGKPSPEMITGVLAEEGIKLADAFMVGDRLSTDFQMCLWAGIDFVCVLSGEATRESIEDFGSSPWIVTPSVAGLLS